MKRLAVLAPLFVVACDSLEPLPSSTNVAVAVAPLTLPGLTDACYNVWVTNAVDGGGTVTWRKDMVCASTYGNGQGDIGFVGPCDAVGGASMGSVNIALVDLWTSGTVSSGASGVMAHDTYQNPCGTSDYRPSYASGSGAYNSDGFGVCTKNFQCVANADAKASFDLTILRDASQGFFDIAVAFEDIFCSAKFDCSAGNLLFAADQQRHETAVLGFACTAGPGAAATHLYMDDVVLSCDNTVVATLDVGVDPAPGPGNQMTAGTVNDSGNTNPLFQYAVYRGTEALAGFAKHYWNVAIGFDVSDLAGKACKITTRATASGDALAANSTPTGSSYPEIVFDVPINGAGNAALTCGKLALDATTNGPVRTSYTTSDCLENHVAAASGDVTAVDTSCLVCAPGFVEDPGDPGHCCGGAGGACCNAGTACFGGLTCATSVDTCGCGSGFACGTGCCAAGQICGANGTCQTPAAGCMTFDSNVRTSTCANDGTCPETCLEILQLNPTAQSGIYMIDPDGNGGAAPIQAQCDMVLDGGGWTLIGYEPPGTPNPATNAGNLQFLAKDTNNPSAIATTTAAGIIGTRFDWGSQYNSARLNWCVPATGTNIFARFDTPADLFEDTRKDTFTTTLHLTNFFTNDAQLTTLVTSPSNARFCRSAVQGTISGNPLFRPGDTSWALKDLNDDKFACGCNSGSWQGVGTYYGGASPSTQSVCSAQGGGWAGSKANGVAKGAINTHRFHFWIR